MPRVGAEPAGGGRRRRRRRRGQAASEREALAALQRLVSADSAAALRIAIDDATPHAGAIEALVSCANTRGVATVRGIT